MINCVFGMDAFSPFETRRGLKSFQMLSELFIFVTSVCFRLFMMVL
jgi:hypothetical protein